MASASRRILIVGSGFGGLALAIRLKRAGHHDFTILEQADRLGGTWRDNSYPGAACDVPSMLYCLSFEQKTDWTRKWSDHDEILAYMDACAAKHGLLPHIRFGVGVSGARFDERHGTWTVRTTTGEDLTADVLVSGVGQLHRPRLPDLPGLDAFRGERFHSARWNHACDLTGKRVAVVGNAASAIQFIPRIATQAARVSVFQRSANWMVRRNDRTYPAWEKWLYAHVPLLARLYRWKVYLRGELLFYPVMRRRRWAVGMFEKAATQYREETIADPALRRTLAPDYPIGGKRILISDDFFAALTRDNVEVITAPIERATETGLVTRDGREVAADVLIFATGFETNPFLAPMHVEGLGGRILAEEWAQGARAYYGLTVAGFPNFFMLYGPNTNLGHNSIIFMLEAQVRYILNALRTLIDEDLAWLDLRPEVLESYNAGLQAALRDTAWAAAGDSWYKDAEGRITNNWPYSTIWYWWRTRHFDLGDYRAMARAAIAAAAAAGPRQAA